MTHVLMTAHKGADIYTACRLCGADVYLKRGRPTLYSAQPDKLVWVCWECAKREDPFILHNLVDLTWYFPALLMIFMLLAGLLLSWETSSTTGPTQ